MSITVLIIVVTSVVSVAAFRNRELLEKLLLWPPAVSRRKEYYRLLSYGLVHADVTHLLFNMITLYFFGSAMEPLYVSRLGPVGYVLFYLGGLLVSILPSYLRSRDDSHYHSLGASGAVSATLFAFILIQPWAMLYIFFVPAPAIVFAVLYMIYSMWMDRRGGDNVNHSAHLWGAGYGVVFTIVLEPRVLGLFLERLLHPGLF